MRRLVAIAAAFLALASMIPHPAAARQVYNAVGANGDRGDLAECPDNEVLMGFSGRAGVWIDQIQLMCAQVFSDGSLGPTHVYGPAFGGNGGGPTANACSGSRLAQIDPELTGDSKKVAHISFRCAASDSGYFYGGSEVETASTKVRCGLFRGCDPGSIPTNVQGCSGNDLPVGLTVRYGAHLNAVGLVCDERQPIAVAAAAPPPPPAPEPPQPPQRPIKHTARAGGGTTSSTSTSTSSIPTSDFTAADWNVTSDPGIPFHLIMHEDEGPGSMWGEMKFDDPHWNGTLVGKLKGLLFHFTYEQVNAGISGSGTLLLTTTKLLVGEVKTDEDPPRTFKWLGRH